MPLPSSADPGTVVVDGMAFKLLKPTSGEGQDLLQMQQLGSYAQGITLGSPDVNSHPYLSTWGLMDLTGGHGIVTHQAGVTDNRYRYATLDVSRPGLWAPRWKVDQKNGATGFVTFMPLGDLLYSGNVEMYGAFGTDLHIWDEATDSWTDTTQNLNAAPVNTAVAFKGTGTLKLFIPLGTGGYDTWTGAAFAHVASDSRMFCVFGGSSLIRLDTTGQLYHSEDGTTWASFGTDGKIDGALTAYGINEWRDEMGNPTLIINTSGGAFTFDPAGPTLYPQDLKFPAHPTQGLAAAVWRGVYYVSVGMGLHSYTGSVIGAMGLDRDDGLPVGIGMGSSIVSLAPQYNNLYALVQGDPAPGTTTASVQRFDGYGWHSVFELESDTATRLVVSGARGAQRLWWGDSAASYTCELPIGFNNPRQIMEAGSGPSLESFGSLETGFSNMGMPGSRKVAVSVGIRIESDPELIVLDYPMTLEYRLRETDDWSALLGPYSEGGAVMTPSGSLGDTYYYWFDANFEGVVFDEIELRLESTNSIIVKWVALYFMKVLSGNYSWNAALDLSNTFEDVSPELMAAKVNDLITSGRIVTMLYRDTPYKVRVADWSGADSTGRADTRSVRTVSLLQIRDRP